MLDLYSKTSEELMSEFLDINERINNLKIFDAVDKLKYELYSIAVKRIEDELICRGCI